MIALLFVAATVIGGDPAVPPPPPPAPIVVVVAPAPVPAPDPAAPAAAPTTATGVAPVGLSGHYTCLGPQADRYSTVGGCSLDPGGDPGPNVDSDRPEATVAGRNPDYSARLDAEGCVAIPVLCSVDSSGHYR